MYKLLGCLLGSRKGVPHSVHDLTWFYALPACRRVLHFRKARGKSKTSSLDVKSSRSEFKSSDQDRSSVQPESSPPVESKPSQGDSVAEETEDKGEESES